MKHPTRWDIPKGHVDPGETDLECALRELAEETAIAESDIEIDPNFVFEHQYEVDMKCYGKKPVIKTLIVYLAELTSEVNVVVTEHEGFEWFCWSPPHKIQQKTINPLLEEVDAHWKRRPN